MLEALAAAILGLIVAGLAAELLARWWIRNRAACYVWPPGLLTRHEVDRVALPELAPVARFDVNQDGERGGDPPPPGASCFRVLVAGGSAAECYYLDQDVTWPGVVQRILREPESRRRLGRERVHVGSVGRSVVGAEGLEMIFEEVLPRYRRLDAVVIMAGATDVVSWIGKDAPARFERFAPRPREVFWYHREREFGWKPSMLALNEVLRRARNRWMRPLVVKANAGHRLTDSRAMRARAAVVRADVPDPTPVMDNFERHFRRALELARAKASHVLVVLQPCFDKERHTPEELAHFWSGGVGNPFHEEVTVYYEHGVVARLMALMNERAARAAASLGIRCVDLMALLERSLATYYDYFHFTEKGAEDVGRAVAEALLDDVAAASPVPQAAGEPRGA